jgi:hypothetical protein
VTLPYNQCCKNSKRSPEVAQNLSTINEGGDKDVGQIKKKTKVIKSWSVEDRTSLISQPENEAENPNLQEFKDLKTKEINRWFESGSAKLS